MPPALTPTDQVQRRDPHRIPQGTPVPAAAPRDHDRGARSGARVGPTTDREVACVVVVDGDGPHLRPPPAPATAYDACAWRDAAAHGLLPRRAVIDAPGCDRTGATYLLETGGLAARSYRLCATHAIAAHAVASRYAGRRPPTLQVLPPRAASDRRPSSSLTPGDSPDVQVVDAIATDTVTFDVTAGGRLHQVRYTHIPCSAGRYRCVTCRPTGLACAGERHLRRWLTRLRVEQSASGVASTARPADASRIRR